MAENLVLILKQSTFTCFVSKENKIFVSLTKLLKVKVLTKRHITIFYLVHIAKKHQHYSNEVS